MSDGDELYHVVWDNTNGLVGIKRPGEIPSDAKFEIRSFNFEQIGRVGQKNVLDSKHWLYTVQIDTELLQKFFLSSEDYKKKILDAEGEEGGEGKGDVQDKEEVVNDMDKLRAELIKRQSR